MLHGASIPFIAKLCAVAVVTTGVGVGTYEVATGTPDKEVEVSTDASMSDAEQDVLAFAEEFGPDTQSKEPFEVEDATPVEDKEVAKDSADDEEPADAVGKDESDGDHENRKQDEHVDEEDHDKNEEHEPADTTAPELVILHPADGSHYDDKHVVFEGETEPGAVVKAGPYEATVDAEGNWRIELILSPGANRAVLSAFDTAGNVAEASVTVHLDVEEEKPVEEDEPKVVEFSANQKWGSCEEEVPYDIFWGTATPKTVVHIVSAHGSAEVEVGKHGHWEKKVYFENAPRGESFLVVVEGANGRAEFEFVAVEFAVDDEGEGEGEHSA